MMTPDQCRAARGLLKWTQDELAERSRVSAVTIRNYENEKTTPQPATLSVLRQAMETAGIGFIAPNGGGAGVRWRDNPAKAETGGM